MTDNGYSLADIAAASGNNRNGSMAGDWAWIIILLLFGWGNENGGLFGNRGGGSNSGGANGYTLATDFANIERKLDGINNGICDSTYEIVTNMNGNFRTLDGAICNIGYQNLQNTNAIQTQLAQCCCDTRAAIQDNTTQGVMNTNQLAQQIERCCCANEKDTMQTRFDMQAYNCNTLQAIDKVGDRIIDYMASEKAQALRDENQALRLAASQSAQNQYIINALRPMPIPAYQSCNPWAASYGCGCNSGCGSF